MSLRLAFLSLLALLVSACGQSNGSEKKGGPGMGFPPPEVSVATVTPRTLPLTFEYTGQTAGSREGEVRARVAGIMLKRNFVEGAPVKHGQTLLTTVIQVDPIWVNFGVPDNEQAQLAKEAQAGRVALPRNGQFEIALKRADGAVYERTGRLNFNDVRVSPVTGTREARAEIP